MDDSSGGGAAQIWTATLGELLALKSPPSEEQQLHTARRGRPLTSPNQKSKHPWATAVVGTQTRGVDYIAF